MKKKYHWLSFLILEIIFVFAGCSKEKEAEVKESFDSIVEKGGSEIELPEGVKLVENPKDFKAVTLDQSYQIEEDSNIYCSSPEMTTDGTNAYIYDGMYIKILDVESKTCQYLCSNPQCSHFGEECNAYFYAAQGIQYYKGALYTLVYEDVMEGEIIAQKVVLYKISLDGVTRDRVCEMATINVNDLATLEDGHGYSCSMYWTIHRGYIYYVYDIGTSGMPDNTYYNNMSNYICRMKLEEGAAREYIMPLEKGSRTENTWLFGSGSYIYYFGDMMEGKGILYRFNTEAKEVEKLPLSKRSVGDYVVGEDYLCYIEEGDSGVYKYHFSDQSTEKILNCSEYDENYKSADNMGIFRDNQYLYVSNMIDKETYLTRCLVFDFEGHYVSAFDLRAGEENGYVGIRIIGDKSVLLTAGSDYYYFSKEEIKTGKIQPVQVSDSTAAE